MGAQWACQQGSGLGELGTYSQAAEELKREIAAMANIQSIIWSSSSSGSDKADIQAQADAIAKSGGGSIMVASNGQHAESMHIEYRNNFIVFIDSSEIIPGSPGTKISMNWKQERSWKAWLRIRARVGIVLPEH